MTFRARPVVKRTQKPNWESRDRRNFYLNLGFGLVVLAAILILGIAVAVNYYNEHLVSVGSVDGQSITRDDLRQRGTIEQWRLDEAGRRIQTLLVAGRLTQAQADLQKQYLQQQAQNLGSFVLERIIDSRILAKLAPAEGVTVTDADIDARLIEEATTKEERHAWQIEVKPQLDSGATLPTAAQVEAARTKITQALTDIKAGKSWDDIAKTVSTDTSTAAQAGDLGWLSANDSQADEAFLKALFAAQVNSPTDVMQGADGIFRIGRVTEIAPESVDSAYTAKLVNDGIDLAKYRAVVATDLLRTKIEDKLVADATKPAPQREVSEIYLAQATVDLPPEAVKVRHILFSPNDDPTAAQNGSIPADDPAWTKAKLDADAAYAQLRADISQFDAVARAQSDEQSARGPDGSGGVLDSYVTAAGGYVPEFSKPILDAKAVDGQLLPPIKTAFGYHVVQVLSHKPDLAQIKSRIDGGADFATIARDVSEGQEASKGGQLGWIARGQLQKELIDAIFAAPIGKTSEVVTVAGDGAYLFKITAEEQRTPEGRQLDDIRSRVFSDWYDPKKAAVKVERDPSLDSSSG
jgi:parvulin-like peptidyl-prolyl isomerase